MSSGSSSQVSRSASLVQCRYGYDAANVLVRTDVAEQSRWRIWRGSKVINEIRRGAGGESSVTWLRGSDGPFAELVDGQGARRTLLASALSGSVLLEADDEVRPVQNAPYGQRTERQGVPAPVADIAYNGELLDAASGFYLLGAGHHRPYSPIVGCFLAPDRASPFGRGGLNALAYCAGDPINRADPSGHFWKWVVAAVGLVAGAIAVAASLGTATIAVGAVMALGVKGLTASGAGAIAGVTLGAASMAVEATAMAAMGVGDEKTAGILGWVGLGLGVVGLAPAVGKAAVKGAAQLATRYSRFSQRIGSIKNVGLSGRGAPKAASGWADDLSGASHLDQAPTSSYGLTYHEAINHFKNARSMHKAQETGYLNLKGLTEHGKDSVAYRFFADTGLELDEIPADWMLKNDGIFSRTSGQRVYSYGFEEIPPYKEWRGFTVAEVSEHMSAPHNVEVLPYVRNGRVDPRVAELTGEIRRLEASKPVKVRHLSSRPY